MKLVLFGGVAGVGKSTLLSWLESTFSDAVKLLDPGEMFRRYFYHEKVKTIDEIEELIVSRIEEMSTDTVAVIHWHYAVRRPTGYIPQIDFSRLKKIAENKSIEQVVLIVVEAPVNVIRERRLADYASKSRPLSEADIQEEVALDEEFLKKQHEFFSERLGGGNVTVFRLTNVDLKAATGALGTLFVSLV